MGFWTCEICGCGVEASSPYLVRAMGWTVARGAVHDVAPALCPRCMRIPVAPQRAAAAPLSLPVAQPAPVIEP
ncbi:MAG: hypothetical protein AB1689_15550 [Thermodesulfobacteriota bacterium]